MLAPLLATLTLTSPALAGTGPWTVGQGDQNVYVGTYAQRFDEVAGPSGSLSGDNSPVGEGVSTFGLQGLFTYGLLPRVELSAEVPWARVRANSPTAGLCATLGPAGCRTTEGLGVITLKGKGALLSELSGDPLSLSVGAVLRHGTFTADTRGRLTNLGEGTTDLGGFASVGRGFALGEGYWTAAADLGGYARLPNTRSYPDPDGGTLSVPGPELYADLEALFTPRFRVTLGPAVSALWRPLGIDLGDLDAGNIDSFSALRVLSVVGGGKLILRNDQDVTATLAVLHTIYAQNNPSDNLVVSAGVSIHNPISKLRRGF
ncbi:MAG: hypothetical protein H6740_24180 [Alphaproteobacteria bacterium]|nr:hypothetical protein [Alphaproteobacteria bacterium]